MLSSNSAFLRSTHKIGLFKYHHTVNSKTPVFYYSPSKAYSDYSPVQMETGIVVIQVQY